MYATEVPNGFLALTHLFLVAAAVLIAARVVALVALGALDRVFRIDPDVAARYPGLEARASRYYPLLRQTLSAVIVALTVLAVAQVWGIDVLGWFGHTALGGRVVSAFGTILVMVVIALAVWEASNASIEHRVALLARSDQPVRAARLRTLLPMLRTTLLVVIVVVVGLTALSEIGVNIAPLLAGAGIVGVAIGFGSQKLVQDVITGTVPAARERDAGRRLGHRLGPVWLGREPLDPHAAAARQRRLGASHPVQLGHHGHQHQSRRRQCGGLRDGERCARTPTGWATC